jgi:hypothetical protein
MKNIIKIGKDLSKKEFDFMNSQRIKNYGKEVNLLDRKAHGKSYFFFVKENNKIAAFGFLRPFKCTYKNEKYNLFALGGIMSVEKGKGYGTVLIQNMIKFLKKKNKTGLGFCGKKTAEFYKKAGLKVKQNFSHRIEMENPKTGERIKDPDKCPGIYFEGKDKFVTKVAKTKGIATYWMQDIEEPHF